MPAVVLGQVQYW